MKFVCDAMLGKLAKYLRILGLDAPLAAGPGDLEQCGTACFFLTRRLALRGSPRVVFIRSDRARDQIKEIIPVIKPFIDPQAVMMRCIRCNAVLGEVPKTEVEGNVPEFVYHRYGAFRQCPLCGRVYWEGSHTTGMADFVKEVLEG